MEALINIDVPELETAIEFYQRAAGLTLSRRLFDGTVAELSGASVRIFLLQKDKGSSPVPEMSLVRDYRRHWTPVHFDLVVSNIEVAIEMAVAAGASLEGDIHSYVWGHQACLCDPFGNGFCFVQWLGDGYSEVP